MEENVTKDIITSMLEYGKYTEKFEIMPGLTITLKTRTLEQDMETKHKISQLSETEIKTTLDFNYYNSILNLAHAIEDINGVLLEGSIDDKINKLKNMPMPIIALISSKLEEFDKKVMDAVGINNLKK